MVEDLIEDKNGLVRAAHIKMSNYRTTYPIVKLCTPNRLENHQEATDEITHVRRAKQYGLSAHALVWKLLHLLQT